MADEDEIDVLGDFSFNSCFAQNSQGIPSCSDREDTVHPQWLLDSPATNWYDTQNIDKNRPKEGPSRKLSGNNTTAKQDTEQHTTWTQMERDLLKKEMIKYGRNVNKISQILKTKTNAEIQALIEAEHGIELDAPLQDLVKLEEVPPAVQEEIVSESLVSMNDVLSIVSTGVPTIPVTKKPFKKKNSTQNFRNNLIKPKAKIEPNINTIDGKELYYEDDLIVGSIESVGSQSDATQMMTKKLFMQKKEKVTTMKKIGNHRRKVSRNYDKERMRNKGHDYIKSPQRRQRKDSSLSNDSVKSPQMQIVLGSGQALPVSEGEQVIKIEKKDTECESDIEVDIDSDTESSPIKLEEKKQEKDLDGPVAVPLRKFEPMPKRNRKIPLDGGGGYTIMHTESGDLYEIGQEPRKERQPKKPVINLIQCRFYNAEKPAPCEVWLHASALLLMDAHAHSSRAEVMGLLGGRWAAPRLRLRLYRRVRAQAAPTHCDMDAVSQARAGAWLRARGAAVGAWHHSHPRFPPAPSEQDLRSQHALQAALAWPLPFLALVTSQHWPPGRRASTLRCFRVEEYDEATDTPVGYQLSVKVVPDLTPASLPEFLRELRDLWCNFSDRDHLKVDMVKDVCPEAGLTYLEKCISSVRHHMHSAGYEDDDPLIEQLIQGIRDIFR